MGTALWGNPRQKNDPVSHATQQFCAVEISQGFCNFLIL